MNKTHLLRLALVCLGALPLAACASKSPVVSTTVTRETTATAPSPDAPATTTTTTTTNSTTTH